MAANAMQKLPVGFPKVMATTVASGTRKFDLVVGDKMCIRDSVWDNGGKFVEENTLMVNIRRLRTKVEKDASHPEYIKTVHGMGYLWEERK